MPDISAQRLAELIGKLRHDRDISQQDVADAIGVDRNKISRWENATAGRLDYNDLAALADYLGWTMTQLDGYLRGNTVLVDADQPKLEELRPIIARLSLKDAATLLQWLGDRVRRG